MLRASHVASNSGLLVIVDQRIGAVLHDQPVHGTRRICKSCQESVLTYAHELPTHHEP
jgi:hypothetical protein